MTSKEARRFKCKPGYWLENVAPLGEAADWQERVKPQDVPATVETLFGYDVDTFMRKQYK